MYIYLVRLRRGHAEVKCGGGWVEEWRIHGLIIRDGREVSVVYRDCCVVFAFELPYRIRECPPVEYTPAPPFFKAGEEWVW
ncbi:hypothetical protein [Caldivirga sp.]|jgi:hypothetical protein|uniref:hypothetical protein n=1 Tax=Caldivirga sp. TaxID=2080243 RepID=UPI003D109050